MLSKVNFPGLCPEVGEDEFLFFEKQGKLPLDNKPINEYSFYIEEYSSFGVSLRNDEDEVSDHDTWNVEGLQNR